ncbi:GNAT family N-acetyltransferase [Maridesulfovibrio salexigens]|uniref:GCN5-related N-acetyltransferase n=1 Tax=Maridesulfovibrio salexigens (strain ATCC 14822 / DSM 2638 / NCIMB 8403 / VKM B-1763) TaxID=526222 RepID=C6BXZ3_MARSD|nr:GNAT family N-acetyltransferase [Maridesulfovibrio salexigens]ACS80523.1 GCN5-related N-acetyltransferase [Maridesulfovibrio salexigens DSM 2638]
MKDFKIRTMTRDELDWAVDMAANEGWNPGLNDAEAFYAQDPNGFLIGLLNDTPIGCISAVSYDRVFGFIGFYIVAKPYRGKGYGMQLWRAAMERIQGHVAGLDGVFEQQENYSKSGFDFQYSNIRFEFDNTIQAATTQSSSELIKAEPAMLEELVAYEDKLFPCSRETFLSKWLTLPDSVSLASRTGGRINGYGTIRKCRSGSKIGPLFADNEKVAELIFQNLCAEADTDSLIYLDVPEINDQGLALAERYGMKKVFGTARMYAGSAPDLDLNRIFGVTTFELG